MAKEKDETKQTPTPDGRPSPAPPDTVKTAPEVEDKKPVGRPKITQDPELLKLEAGMVIGNFIVVKKSEFLKFGYAAVQGKLDGYFKTSGKNRVCKMLGAETTEQIQSKWLWVKRNMKE